MEKEKRLKIASWIFTAGLIFIAIYSVSCIFLRDQVASLSAKAFGQINPIEMSHYEIKLLGRYVCMVYFMWLCAAIFCLWIVWKGFRFADRSAALAIIVGGLCGHTMIMYIHYTTQEWWLLIADNIGMAPIGLAFGLTFREFLKKPS